MTSNRVLAARSAVEQMGGPVKAARDLGIENYQTVQSWEANGIPPAHCVKVERALGGRMSRRELRPDDWHSFWPELAEPATAAITPEPAKAGV